MSKQIKFKIDGKACTGTEGQTIVEAAKDNGVYIPTLCNYQGLKPVGTCRICTVRVNGKPMAACTSAVREGMDIENDTPFLQDMRKAIVEMLFVEGNHLCPACEKSGRCDLQALAYRFKMDVPRFPYLYPVREVDASYPLIMIDHNRCVLCKRCVRGIKTKDGRSIFAFARRGDQLRITIAEGLASKMNEELAKKSMAICPVGAILKKEKGFDIPIGERKYDKKPIGSDIEAKSA